MKRFIKTLPFVALACLLAADAETFGQSRFSRGFGSRSSSSSRSVSRNTGSSRNTFSRQKTAISKRTTGNSTTRRTPSISNRPTNNLTKRQPSGTGFTNRLRQPTQTSRIPSRGNVGSRTRTPIGNKAVGNQSSISLSPISPLRGSGSKTPGGNAGGRKPGSGSPVSRLPGGNSKTPIGNTGGRQPIGKSPVSRLPGGDSKTPIGNTGGRRPIGGFPETSAPNPTKGDTGNRQPGLPGGIVGRPIPGGNTRPNPGSDAGTAPQKGGGTTVPSREPWIPVDSVRPEEDTSGRKPETPGTERPGSGSDRPGTGADRNPEPGPGNYTEGDIVAGNGQVVDQEFVDMINDGEMILPGQPAPWDNPEDPFWYGEKPENWKGHWPGKTAPEQDPATGKKPQPEDDPGREPIDPFDPTDPFTDDRDPKPETDPDPEPEPETETDIEPDPVVEVDPEPEVEIEPEPEVEIEPDPIPETDCDHDCDPVIIIDPVRPCPVTCPPCVATVCPGVVCTPVTEGPIVEEEIPAVIQLVVGMRNTLQAAGIGDIAGTAALDVNGIGLPVPVGAWSNEALALDVPVLGLLQPTPADLYLLDANKQVIAKIRVELLTQEMLATQALEEFGIAQ